MSDTPDRDQVLAMFFADGRLTALPRNLEQRRVVLEAVQARFAPDQGYTEAEVTAILAAISGEVPAVRAALLGLGYLRRDDTHYYRATAPATPPRKQTGVALPDAGGDGIGPEDQAERERIVTAFFREGRLMGWPTRLPAQRLLLEVVQQQFAPDRVYTEREVNAILTPVHADYCFLRRALVDYGYMRRDHGQYQRSVPDLNAPVVID
jgi:hypothetical protein